MLWKRKTSISEVNANAFRWGFEPLDQGKFLKPTDHILRSLCDPYTPHANETSTTASPFLLGVSPAFSPVGCRHGLGGVSVGHPSSLDLSTTPDSHVRGIPCAGVPERRFRPLTDTKAVYPRKTRESGESARFWICLRVRLRWRGYKAGGAPGSPGAKPSRRSPSGAVKFPKMGEGKGRRKGWRSK